ETPPRLRDQPRGDHAGHRNHGCESPERGPHTDGADRPAEERCSDHRAGWIEADDITIHETMASRDGQVHRLLREDIRRAAARAEEHPVAECQLEEAASG